MKRIRIAIVGGGAAGMFCAVSINDKSDVVIFERGERVGRKLSATGNGQGNLTNQNISSLNYFTSSKNFENKFYNIIQENDNKSMCKFMENIGCFLLPDDRGRIYPAGKQASAITDLLRYNLSAEGVEIKTGCIVEKIKEDNGKYIIECYNKDIKESYIADKVVVCTGGKAAKNFGTDGQGYTLVKSLGHSVTELYPSLVQLKTDKDSIKGLKGIRTDAIVTAFINGEKKMSLRGDVIFTDYGVSGDAIFRISAFISDKIENKNVSLSLEFLPDVKEKELKEVLVKKKSISNVLPKGEFLCGIVNNQMGRVLMKKVNSEKVDDIVRLLKYFKLKVEGTLGFDYAQVTKGGIPLEEVDENLQSKKHKNIYFAGEILDVDGECGGYNLQWAFSSGKRVAKAINKE